MHTRLQTKLAFAAVLCMTLGIAALVNAAGPLRAGTPPPPAPSPFPGRIGAQPMSPPRLALFKAMGAQGDGKIGAKDGLDQLLAGPLPKYPEFE